MQMNRLVLLLVSLAICASARTAEAAADQGPREWQPPAYEVWMDHAPAQQQQPLPSQRPSRQNPFGTLFQVPGSPNAKRAKPQAKPKVVCGMTIIPGDPDTDPRIHHEPSERELKFTIRAVTPPVCWSE